MIGERKESLIGGLDRDFTRCAGNFGKWVHKGDTIRERKGKPKYNDGRRNVDYEVDLCDRVSKYTQAITYRFNL